MSLKNCQNIGSEGAAENAAFMHLLIESCRLHNKTSFDYLCSLFRKMRASLDDVGKSAAEFGPFTVDYAAGASGLSPSTLLVAMATHESDHTFSQVSTMSMMVYMGRITPIIAMAPSMSDISDTVRK